MTRAKAEQDELPLGPLETCFGFRLRRAWNILQRDFYKTVRGVGIKQGSVAVLSVISANPGIRQGTVSRLLDVQRTNMVRLIDELSEAGWINRGTVPNDRRSVSLTLTPAGQHLLDKALVQIAAHEARLLADFNAAERAALIDLLGRLSH